MVKNTLAKNTMLLSLGTLLTNGLLFIMVPFFSRWLTVEDYGTFDILITYTALLIPIIGLSSNEALFRFSMDSEDKQKNAEYVTNCLTIFTINSVILFIVISVLNFAFNWHLAYYFFIFALGQIYNVYFRGYLRASKLLNIYSFVNALSTIFIAIFTTLFIRFYQLGLEGIILGYGIGYIIGDLIIVIVTKYWTHVNFRLVSFKGIKELISYSYALIPNSLSWWFINVSDRTVISIFLGSVSNGIYAIAYKIPNILSSIFGVFSVSWQQSATESINDSNRDQYYNRIFNKMIVVLLSLCCGVLSLNSWLFNYIFDAKYYSGYLYAPILIGSIVFATVSQFYGSLQISFKQPKENGITTVIGAVSNVVIHLLLIYFIGLYAAAVSTIVSQMIVCVLRNRRLKKSVELHLTKKAIALLMIYLIFTVLAYFITNIYINIFTVLVATIIVIIANKGFIEKSIWKISSKFHAVKE